MSAAPQMGKAKSPHVLFGGDGNRGWKSNDWTASDDSVRGGSSESHLEISDEIARFYGTLDTETLGGAGFASQRTTAEDQEWDLSDYAGIQLKIVKGDKKRYTFILKDELLPRNDENGREQASISYECDFELPPQDQPGDTKDRTVTIPWDSLNATYRGRLKKDAEPLNLEKVKRFSIMMRSFFGSQKGDFSLSIRSITAVTKIPEPGDCQASNTVSFEQGMQSDKHTSPDIEKGLDPTTQSSPFYFSRGWHIFPDRDSGRRPSFLLAATLIALLATYGLTRHLEWCGGWQ